MEDGKSPARPALLAAEPGCSDVYGVSTSCLVFCVFIFHLTPMCHGFMLYREDDITQNRPTIPILQMGN